MQRINLKKEPCLDAKHQSFAYQIKALKAIQDAEYAAVFHEQGLGKSKIAIDLMLYWLERKEVDTVLFVVKKGLIANWQSELIKHTHMTPKVLTQSRNANFFVFNSPARLMLAHYEVLKSEQERFQLFLKSRNVGAILDESTKIKNPTSAITKSLFLLAPLFKKRIIMTGTPIANRPFDIWAQIYFLDQGKSLGETFPEFKRHANLTNSLSENRQEQDEFERYLGEIFGRISGFTVRETKNSNVIALPNKTIRKVVCEWERNQYVLYAQIQKEMRATVIKNGVPTQDDSDEILKRMLRLVQVASNPKLIDEGYTGAPGKVEHLMDIVEDICRKNQKCIVWTSFTQNADRLSQELTRYGTKKVHGKMNMDRRDAGINAFLHQDNVRVLVTTPGAAKEGLTLTVANHVLFYDRTFSLDDYLQAQDRIHRISQTRECFVYDFIMKESIDEWVDLLLECKMLAAQLTQRDISIGYYKNRMSYDFGTIIRNILNIK